MITIPLAALSLWALSALAQVPPEDATQATQDANGAFLKQLPFNDRQDYEDAKRGFIATLPTMPIKTDKGFPAWDLTAYDFLKKDQPPATVNPSLWHQAQLNMNHGLFKVAERVYQSRGFDLSNMTVIEGDMGLIMIDPMPPVEQIE